MNGNRLNDEHAAGRQASVSRITWFLAVGLISTMVIGAFARFHQQGHGFTYVLDFGATLGLPRLAEVDSTPTYIHPQVGGYDGQMYAQLALRPTATDPELARVLDNPPYRARRMFMPWTAYLAGLGRPWWILNAQALLNGVAWVALGVLLLRWFRPGRWDDLVRWAGVMLSAGMLSSLRHALTDGPALLALASCLALIESGHRRTAIFAGAVAGLTRETGVLAGAALAPNSLRDTRGWGRALLGVAAMLVPLALWMWHLRTLAGVGAYHGGGFANFTWPFAGFVERWMHLVDVLVQRGWMRMAGFSVLLHLALTVQVAFVVVRPKWSDPWWRIAVVHVMLLASLNTQVWEGHPGASARVLLPLLLAFNRLVPRGAAWMCVLLVGNLSIFAGLVEMRAPPQEITRVLAASLGQEPQDPTLDAAIELDEGFLVLEGGGAESWRWTSGDARARIVNRSGRELRATVHVTVRSRRTRSVEVRAGTDRIAQWKVGNERRMLASDAFVVPAEGIDLQITAGVPDLAPAGDARPVVLEFSAIELRVEPVAVP